MRHTNHINDFELWRQRRDELFREAKNERLARRIKESRRSSGAEIPRWWNAAPRGASVEPK
ncbi:MAG: hypothetical protein ACRDSJ_01890 [Rubrobacteraceae bacterium]